VTEILLFRVTVITESYQRLGSTATESSRNQAPLGWTNRPAQSPDRKH